MNLSSVSKYFPTPEFINPRRIGVSFSDSSIKAIYLHSENNNSEIKSVVIPLEKGIISEGKIIDEKRLVTKISALKEVFDSRFVFFTLPDELTFVFNVSVPVDKKGDITESVSFMIEENVPFKLSETIFDFVPTGLSSVAEGYQSKVVVVASEKSETEKFVRCVRLAGFDPLGCVHESQAIANALLPDRFKGVVSIVHAREERVGIYLVKDGVVYFSTIRNLEGGDYKTQFIDEYMKFLEYSIRYGKSADQVISAIFVCGQFDYAKKSIEALTGIKDHVGKVKLSNVWTNVLEIEKTTPSMSYEDSLNFAGPIGAVVSDLT